MVDFEKNGAKLSLMMFLTTFVPKEIGNVFANVDFHVNPPFCRTVQQLVAKVATKNRQNRHLAKFR